MAESFIHECHAPHFGEKGRATLTALIEKEAAVEALLEKRNIGFMQIEPAFTIIDSESMPYSALFSVRSTDGNPVVSEVLNMLPEDAIALRRGMKAVLMQYDITTIDELREVGLEAAAILNAGTHSPGSHVTERAAEIIASTLQRAGTSPSGLAHFLESAENMAMRTVSIVSRAAHR